MARGTSEVLPRYFPGPTLIQSPAYLGKPVGNIPTGANVPQNVPAGAYIPGRHPRRRTRPRETSPREHISRGTSPPVLISRAMSPPVHRSRQTAQSAHSRATLPRDLWFTQYQKPPPQACIPRHRCSCWRGSRACRSGCRVRRQRGSGPRLPQGRT